MIKNIHFDPVLWERSLQGASANAKTVAEKWKLQIINEGLDGSTLKPCNAEHDNGTELPSCWKLYLPVPLDASGPWGMVFVVVKPQGIGWLYFLAFGERHPDNEKKSVYWKAHRELHALSSE